MAAVCSMSQSKPKAGGPFHGLGSETLRPLARPESAFSLVELLVVIAIVGMLSAMLLPALARSKAASQAACCISNLQQLGEAAQLYLMDNQDVFFSRCGVASAQGQEWWFGWLQGSSVPEGHRGYDLAAGCLYPYLGVDGVRLCPSPFWSSPLFKPKGTNVICSYGCNGLLFPGPGQAAVVAGALKHPADVAWFADSAQVNTFQPPASPSHPMFEEFYYVDLETNYSRPDNQPNGQFRHGQKSNVTFADGHVAALAPVPGSYDSRLPEFVIGQLPPSVLLFQ